METSPNQYYCQTIEFIHGNNLFQSVFCLASIPLNDLQKNVKKFLHPQELEYFCTLAFEKRQLSFLLGHFVAKQAATLYTNGISPTEMIIEYGTFLNPLIRHPGKAGMHVSYSHANECGVALAYPDTYPMGVDIEVVDAEKIEVMKTQLTREEIEIIHSLTDASPDLLITLLWTIKEALSKVLCTGMMSPFDIYAIKLMKAEEHRWISEFKNFGQYQALSFQLGPYICSIVFPKQLQICMNVESIKHWFKNTGKQ